MLDDTGYVTLIYDAEDRVRLREGPNEPQPVTETYLQREAIVLSTVAHYLPEFAETVRGYHSPERRQFGRKQKPLYAALHQNMFGVELDADEIFLLGLAVKYCGIHNVPLRILGTHRGPGGF